MSSPRGRTRNVWLLPIILLACAFMVTPAGVLLGRDSEVAAASHHAPHVAPASSRPGGGNPASLLDLGKLPSRASLPSSPSLSSPIAPGILSPLGSRPWLDATPEAGGPAFADTGSLYGPLVSPPNLGLANDPTASPSSIVSPGYQAPPAPLGLADYGVGVNGGGGITTYNYSAADFLGEVTFQAPPNVTDPGSAGVMDPSAGNLGYVGSPYEFSLQLNTIGDNLTEPGTADGWVWAQNVIDMNGTAIHFVDDLWNLTADSAFGFAPNAIVSACGFDNLTTMLEIEGGVVQCIGGTVPISGADFPLSVALYNNLSVNGANQDVLTFGYLIVADGVPLSWGTSASVVLANPTGAAPVSLPTYVVNGSARAPAQPSPLPELLQDSEITFGGPIGGTNAVFHTLNGTVRLEYNAGAGWSSVPSAFNFGSDTGETAIGIADYWESAGVEEVNQGPSFLYGLWNTPANLSVAPGSITFQGTVDPNYGFVFLSNVAPDANATNQSYVPTGWNGAFNTTLPPAIPSTSALGYFPTLYAAGIVSVNGTPFTNSVSGYSFGPVTPSFGIDAPIYLNGTAQANALAYNLTGRPILSGAPYNFSNLTVNLPLAFTHLNDYAFPSFVIFFANSIYPRVYVNNTSEGQNVPGGELYTLDYATSGSGWMYPPPATVGPLQNFTEEFDVWDSYLPSVQNETLVGAPAFSSPGGGGGSVFFFNDGYPSAVNITSVTGSYGVTCVYWYYLYADNLTAVSGANALDVIASYGAYVFNVTAVGYLYTPYNGSVGIYALGSQNGRYYDLFAEEYATAYVAGGDFGGGPLYGVFGSVDDSIFNDEAIFNARGFALAYSYYDTISEVAAAYGALAGNITASFDVDVNNVDSFEAGGIDLFQARNTTITGLNETEAEFASLWVFSNGTVLNDSVFNETYFALELYDDNQTSIDNLTVNGSFEIGVVLEDTNATTLRNVLVENSFPGSWGLVVYAALNTTFVGLTVNTTGENTTGVVVEASWATTFLGTSIGTVNYLAIGLGLYDDGYTNLTGTFVSDVHYRAIGIDAQGVGFTQFNETYVGDIHYQAAGVVVQGGYVTRLNQTFVVGVHPFADGVVLVEGEWAWLNNTAVVGLAPFAAGILVDEQWQTWFNDTFIVDNAPLSAGVFVTSSEETFFNGTEAYDGDGWAVGVNASYYTSFNGTETDEQYGGVQVNNSTDTSFASTWLDNTTFGVEVGNSSGTSFAGTYVNDTYVGVQVNHSASTTFTATWVNYTLEGIWVNASSDTSVSGLTVLRSGVGAVLNNTTGSVVSDVSSSYGGTGVVFLYSPDATLTGVFSYYSTGAYAYRSNGLTASDISSDFGTGLDVDNSTGVTVTDVSAADLGMGVVLSTDTGSSVTDATATDGAIAVLLLAGGHDTVTSVTATQAVAAGGLGVQHDTFTDITALNGSEGAVFLHGSNDTATDVYGSNGSLAAGTAFSDHDTFTDVTVTDESVGVLLENATHAVVSGVTATNATLSPLWNGFFAGPAGVPVAAVAVSSSSDSSVSDVTATNYPAAIYANASEDLIVANVNATGDDVGVLLNGTAFSLFENISAYEDGVGFQAQPGYDPYYVESNGNVLTTSSFVNDTSYGVELLTNTYFNVVYDNDFFGDNGATTTYSPLHIQAYSATPDNAFNSSTEIGNYWADWHTYADGVLAPYLRRHRRVGLPPARRPRGPADRDVPGERAPVRRQLVGDVQRRHGVVDDGRDRLRGVPGQLRLLGRRRHRLGDHAQLGVGHRCHQRPDPRHRLRRGRYGHLLGDRAPRRHRLVGRLQRDRLRLERHVRRCPDGQWDVRLHRARPDRLHRLARQRDGHGCGGVPRAGGVQPDEPAGADGDGQRPGDRASRRDQLDGGRRRHAGLRHHLDPLGRGSCERDVQLPGRLLGCDVHRRGRDGLGPGEQLRARGRLPPGPLHGDVLRKWPLQRDELVGRRRRHDVLELRHGPDGRAAQRVVHLRL